MNQNEYDYTYKYTYTYTYPNISVILDTTLTSLFMDNRVLLEEDNKQDKLNINP